MVGGQSACDRRCNSPAKCYLYCIVSYRLHSVSCFAELRNELNVQSNRGQREFDFFSFVVKRSFEFRESGGTCFSTSHCCIKLNHWVG